jgi:hypothetical protein
LPLALRHFGGMLFEADEADLIDALRAVGIEDESENLGDPVVEHPALARILMLLAIGARGMLIAVTARADLAPGGPMILLAPRTSSAQIRPARSAIQPAARDQFRIGDDFLHDEILHTVGYASVQQLVKRITPQERVLID